MKKIEVKVAALLPNGNHPIFRTTMIGGFWTAVKESDDGEIVCHLVQIKRVEDEPDQWQEAPNIRCQLAATHHVTLVGDLAERPPKMKGLA